MRAAPSASMLGLVLLLACRSSPVDPPIVEEPKGTLRLTVVTTGVPGVESLRFRLDDAPVVDIEADGLFTHDLPAGAHIVQIEVPGHCSANRYAPDTIDIVANEVLPRTWSIHCPNAAPPGLYFARWTPEGGDRLFRSNSVGTGLEAVPTPLRAYRPRMNPSRTRLAWIAYDDGRLWMMDADGEHAAPTALIGIGDFDWSPDGTRLVVTRWVPSAAEVGIYWPDGRLVAIRDTIAGSDVSWSPVGDRIAYRDGAYIFTLALATGQRVNMNVILPNFSSGIAWSPDGTRLAFKDGSRLRTAKPDGSDLRDIFQGTFEPEIDWRPDGVLVFAAYLPFPDNRPTLFTVPASGGAATRFPTDDLEAHDLYPDWAP